MDTTVETVEPRQVKLTVVVPEAQMERARREVVAAFSRQNKIPGYRPGKAPRSRVAAIVGDEAIEAEALEMASRAAVQQAVQAQGLLPSAPIQIEKAGDEPIVLEALVPLQPEVDLGDYRDMRVEMPEADPIEDSVVEETIEGWRQEMAFLEPTEGAAEQGDVIRLSLVGTLEDKVVYEEEAVALALDGEKVAAAGLPPEVVDELVGLSEGDEASFELGYSEFWPQTELQGKTVAFEATIAGVSRLQLPELDDDLAQQLADVDGLDALRETVREQLQRRAEMAARDAQVESVVDALVEAATLAYPPQLLEREVADLIGDLRQRVERQGFRWEHWLEMQKDNEEKILEDAEANAKQRLERSLAMTAFVESEGIRISDEALSREVEQFTELLSKSAQRGMPDTATLKQQMGSRMLSSRAIERLMAIAAGEAEAGADATEAAGASAQPESESAGEGEAD